MICYDMMNLGLDFIMHVNEVISLIRLLTKMKMLYHILQYLIFNIYDVPLPQTLLIKFLGSEKQHCRPICKT